MCFLIATKHGCQLLHPISLRKSNPPCQRFLGVCLVLLVSQAKSTLESVQDRALD
jgi:hypothetical protein